MITKEKLGLNPEKESIAVDTMEFISLLLDKGFTFAVDCGNIEAKMPEKRIPCICVIYNTKEDKIHFTEDVAYELRDYGCWVNSSQLVGSISLDDKEQVLAWKYDRRG